MLVQVLLIYILEVKEVLKMICPKCSSDNVNIQVVVESQLVTKHHGIIWWLCIGWWWIPIKWLCFTLPALIFKVFGVGKRHKIKNKTIKKAVCQNCGNSWNL
jgi:hypothetical protein